MLHTCREFEVGFSVPRARMPAVRGDGMRGLAVFIADIRNCKHIFILNLSSASTYWFCLPNVIDIKRNNWGDKYTKCYISLLRIKELICLWRCYSDENLSLTYRYCTTICNTYFSRKLTFQVHSFTSSSVGLGVLQKLLIITDHF